MSITGVSMSLGAAVFGGVQGQLSSLINKWLDYKYLCKLSDDKALQDARSTTGDRFLITRRILAIMTASYIFGGPIFAAYFQIPTIVFYSESNGLLSMLFYGQFSIQMVDVHGFVLTPVHTYLAALTWTMYFGGKRV